MSSLRANLFLVALGLSMLGLVMVYSATYREVGAHYLFVRIGHMVVGVAVFFSVSRVRYTAWRRYAPALYLVVLLALVLVLIPGIGLQINGARRWLDLGPLDLQPAEFAKLVAVLVLSCAVARPLDGPLEVRGPVDHVLPALILEERGDARPGLTLANDRAAHSQTRKHLREVGPLLRPAEDEYHGRVEAGEGRRDGRRVGGLGIIYVGNACDLCPHPHAVRHGLVPEEGIPDLLEPGAELLCGGCGEERVLVVVCPREAQLGHVRKTGSAKEQTAIAQSRVAFAHNEGFRAEGAHSRAAYRIFGADECEIN